MKLAFYKAYCDNATWLDIAIGIFSLGRHSHVELVFDDGQSFSVSARHEDGARFEEIAFHLDRWDFIEIDVSKERIAAVRAECEKLLGTGYDTAGALFSITPFCIQRSNKLFCSEAIVNIFNKCGVHQELTEKHGRNVVMYEPFGDGCKYSPSRHYKWTKEIVI